MLKTKVLLSPFIFRVPSEFKSCCGKHKALVRFAALPFTILPVLVFLRSFTCSRENMYTLK